MQRGSNECHFVEFFCGQALLTKAFREIGCRTRAVDVNRILPSFSFSLSLSLALSIPGSPLHDLSGAIGFLTGIVTVWEAQNGVTHPPRMCMQ